MSLLAICSFDLKNANSEDYKNAYADLEELGLTRFQKSDKGYVTAIPTTSAMGKFSGKNSAELRDELRHRIRLAFAARRFESRIFVVVGDKWAWAVEST